VDYMDIVKRAWRVTWRYKILWLFGLFAGGGVSVGSNFSSNSSSSGGKTGSGGATSPADAQLALQQAVHFVERNLTIIVATIVLCTALGVIWWILSVAARGGIVKLVDDAETGRAVQAGDGWRTGFENWLKVFGVSFISGLPAALLGLAAAVVMVIAILGAVRSGAFSSADPAAIQRTVISSLAGGCLFLVVFGVLAVITGVVFGIVKELAVRYAVLEGRGVFDALKAGWTDLWAKRGAFLMFVTTVVVGLVVSFALSFAALAVMMPGVLMIMFGSAFLGAILSVFGVIVLMVLGAVYGALHHAMWTVFFRRMTGREQPSAAAQQGGYPSPIPGGPAFPPPPPGAGYAPPMASDFTTGAPGSAGDPWAAANTLPGDASPPPTPAAPWASVPAPVAPPEPTFDSQPSSGLEPPSEAPVATDPDTPPAAE
jgi:hypothetical protein